MYRSLEHLFNTLKCKCAQCKMDLTTEPPMSYDHSDGVEINELAVEQVDKTQLNKLRFSKPQWAYKVCPKCGYQTSYRKMDVKDLV